VEQSTPLQTCDFLLVRHSNLGPISHRFWDTTIYWLKLRIFSYPSLIRRPRSNFAVKLTVRKLESWTYSVLKLHDSNFNRFRLIHPRDRWTHGRTNRQTGGRAIASQRAIAQHMLSRAKNGMTLNETKLLWKGISLASSLAPETYLYGVACMTRVGYQSPILKRRFQKVRD